MTTFPGREGEKVEFKREWTKRALEDLAAFANHEGGSVFIGVEDNGTVVGWSAGDAELQAIANQVTELLGLRPRIQWEVYEGLQVLALRIEVAPAPIPLRGRYYTRVSSTNREMTGEQLGARFVAMSGVRWDSLKSGVCVDEVDQATYQRFVEQGRERLPSGAAESPSERLLENLDLARDGMLTNAGVMLFTSRPQREFAGATLRVGRFRGGAIADTVDVRGSLWEQYDLGIDATRKHLNVRFEVDPKDLTFEELVRKDIWDYPLEALREAIANALVHRDYTAIGHIEVRVYDDEVRVWSAGCLPSEMTMEKLRDENHGSRPRNPVIAQAFYYAGLIEKWGAGTTLMIHACREHGLPEPGFAETGGGFEVRFSKDRFTGERLRAQGLSENEVHIVLAVKERGQATNRSVQALLGVSARTGARLLGELTSRGLLERRGTTKDVHYVLPGAEG